MGRQTNMGRLDILRTLRLLWFRPGLQKRRHAATLPFYEGVSENIIKLLPNQWSGNIWTSVNKKRSHSYLSALYTFLYYCGVTMYVLRRTLRGMLFRPEACFFNELMHGSKPYEYGWSWLCERVHNTCLGDREWGSYKSDFARTLQF